MMVVALLVVTLLVLVPVVVFTLEVLAAFRPGRSGEVFGQTDRPQVAILVPAHNESRAIIATLCRIKLQLAPGDRLLVVADNCSDDTARLAAENGAEVVERVDTRNRGKGFALDFGVQYLLADPPQVVIVIDADCQVHNGAIDRLAKLALRTGRSVQALYLMHNRAGAGLKQRIAEFAWVVKNQVRPLGLLHMGLPCHLMGTGMAFPWGLLSRAQLANASIVEDMQLGLNLARDGYPPLFCPDARVACYFPESVEAGRTQLTRWQHGHLGMILAEFPGLVATAFHKRDPKLLALALDLAVPPLALLAFLILAVLLLNFTAILLGASALPLYFAVAALGLFIIAVMIAWSGWGRQVISLGSLLALPIYVVARLPVYLMFWLRRQKHWVRTDRD